MTLIQTFRSDLPTHSQGQAMTEQNTTQEPQTEQNQAQEQTQEDNDFPLGQACDLSGEGTCESCQ